MTRKYTTYHPDRSLSGYHWNKKQRQDRYGQFENGQQISPDYICGKKIFYRDKETENEIQEKTGIWPRPKRSGIALRKKNNHPSKPVLIPQREVSNDSRRLGHVGPGDRNPTGSGRSVPKGANRPE